LKPAETIAKALQGGTGARAANVLSNDKLGIDFFNSKGNFANGMKQQFYDMLTSAFKIDG